jgi:hypothetical protein
LWCRGRAPSLWSMCATAPATKSPSWETSACSSPAKPAAVPVLAGLTTAAAAVIAAYLWCVRVPCSVSTSGIVLVPEARLSFCSLCRAMPRCNPLSPRSRLSLSPAYHRRCCCSACASWLCFALCVGSCARRLLSPLKPWTEAQCPQFPHDFNVLIPTKPTLNASPIFTAPFLTSCHSAQ